MTLECIFGIDGSLTKGKRYEILKLTNTDPADGFEGSNWYLIKNDNGLIAQYLDFRFTSIKEEMRNIKLNELLK